jgi:molybdopterin converting factor subunit 1
MRIEIHLFARAKDLAGVSALVVELGEGADVAELRDVLGRERPALRGLIERCAVAVDEEFAGDEVILKAGQRVALLPPVSGGQ